MEKNVASQKWIVFAFDRTDNTPKTGDAANITANLRLDGAAANAVDDTNPTELEDGFYIFDITQAECNADYILMAPASGTADIQVIGCPAAVWTVPANQNAMLIDADGGLPWNADWDAEVQSEVNDGLVALKLDHLVAVADSDDPVDDSIVAKMAASDGDWSGFSEATDSLEALGDDVDAIIVDTEDIQGRIPAALVSGKMDSDAVAISGSTDAADNLEASAETIEVGAAAAGTLSTTQMSTNLTEATNDHYNGRIIIWTSGVLFKQATDITDYDGTTKVLTYTTVTEAPSDGDTFVIL